ncbi:AAEL006358-PA [Aedes aegypti]|uniref:AAEL006358-PA n=1 Tax=Aedes aegypti TaxID=7159 RepID=Q176L5_AEDAE|nr:AAEL006358-PA [Aedes aegypti]
MGTELNNALKFLVSQNDPAATTYQNLRTTLIDHFDRAKNTLVESIKFRHIVQEKDESVAKLIIRRKQGTAHWEYGAFLDRILIEQFLHGLEAQDICDVIIAKDPVTFTAAYEIAHALEATRNTAREVNTGAPSPHPEAANKLGSSSSHPKQHRYRTESPFE